MSDATLRMPAPFDGASEGVLADLWLPMPSARFAPCDGVSCRRQDSTQNVLVLRSGPSTTESAETLAWRRWLLGHHASFVVWRLICRALSESTGHGGCDPDTSSAVHRKITATAELFDVYSALLLYSGSCTTQVYADVIRPRMIACHPAFSGTWSRDYEKVRELLQPPLPECEPGARLKRAVRFNRLVHISVAKRLVPEGNSLLRDAGRVGSPPENDERELFDAFFRTRRAGICVHEFVDQLIVRTELILADLAAYPIFTRYGRDDLDRFQGGLRDHFDRLADIACELLTKG
ncbi:L-tyrosine 3-hydroxylase [Amycolatopsis sp. lyj-90]|uniref:L-tyrosine 3-hydroxylase n=1 Tax=Amycolatopsis sp. lyj-90 TaxID=2789285 RepID=UPI00397D54B6